MCTDAGEGVIRVELVDLPAQRLAGVAHRGPFWQIGEAFAELQPRADALGLSARPGAVNVAAFLDDPQIVQEADLRSIAGVSVDPDVEIGDLDEMWLPAGRFLKGEYIGRYSGLPDAWATLYREHLADGDYKPRQGVRFEVYVTAHGSVSPEQMRTDLYAPIS